MFFNVLLKSYYSFGKSLLHCVFFIKANKSLPIERLKIVLWKVCKYYEMFLYSNLNCDVSQIFSKVNHEMFWCSKVYFL